MRAIKRPSGVETTSDVVAEIIWLRPPASCLDSFDELLNRLQGHIAAYRCGQVDVGATAWAITFTASDIAQAVFSGALA